MGTLIDFLLDNFVYVIFVAIILVFALIGYIVDKSKTEAVKKELTKKEDTTGPDIPLVNIDSNVKLGETVNKMANMNAENVNKEESTIPALKIDELPKD